VEHAQGWERKKWTCGKPGGKNGCHSSLHPSGQGHSVTDHVPTMLASTTPPPGVARLGSLTLIHLLGLLVAAVVGFATGPSICLSDHFCKIAMSPSACLHLPRLVRGLRPRLGGYAQRLRAGAGGGADFPGTGIGRIQSVQRGHLTLPYRLLKILRPTESLHGRLAVCL